MTPLFLAIVNILSYLDRFLVQAVQPLIIRDFQISKAEAGYLISAFVIGYFVFSPIFGYLGDRYRRPPLMALGVFLWSIATISTGLASSLTLFFLARILVGIGEASFVTIAPGYIRDKLKDPIRVNKALSFFSAAMPVGAALGFAVGAQLAAMYGWHMAFVICGIPGIIMAGALLRLPEYRVHAREKETLVPQLGALANLRKIAGIPILVFAILGYVFNNFALVGVSAFVTTYGVELGFAVDQIGLYFGVILLVTGLVGALGGGAISSRMAKRSSDPIRTLMKFVGVSALLGVPFLAAALLTSNQAVFLVCCFCEELLILSGVAPLNTVLVMSSPRELVAMVQGITIAMINLFGSFLSPIVIGHAADRFGLQGALQLCSIALMVSGIIWWIGSYRKQYSEDPSEEAV